MSAVILDGRHAVYTIFMQLFYRIYLQNAFYSGLKLSFSATDLLKTSRPSDESRLSATK